MPLAQCYKMELAFVLSHTLLKDSVPHYVNQIIARILTRHIVQNTFNLYAQWQYAGEPIFCTPLYSIGRTLGQYNNQNEVS